ncbi:MAG: pantoate--beta-alanine ligase [Candidatus Nealsonbacteria bacterium]|nr:pantoate--beta-alanine ligase [Candidatus Nealsonbacteria bacterium]
MPPTSQPELVTTVAELRAALGSVRRGGKTIALIPTMGDLHEGHLSLVRAAKQECDYTVVSIYVNPSQFGRGEDLDKYPRTLRTDLDALAECGVELVLAPGDDEVYRPQHATWVEVGAVGEPLEGRHRPDHFRGVATIVLKLLNMVGPDVAYFGQKDYQQALVIRQMVEDLDVPVELRICPTVREPDGLAMSSRNAYLSPEARQRSLALHRSLELAEQLIAAGQCSAQSILDRMQQELLTAADDARIDYLALADPDTLEPVHEIRGPVVALLAVHIENTRLIDNRILQMTKHK